MTKVQKDLLSLIKNRLFGFPCNITVSEEIYDEAKQQGVSSFIEQRTNRIATNIKVIAEHAILSDVLEGIPFVTIKGFASAYYYPNPEHRSMGDIDFYVDEEHFDSAFNKLIENDYILYKQPVNNNMVHTEFKKHKFMFELHSEINGIPNGIGGMVSYSKTVENNVRLYLSDVIKTSRTVQTEYGPIIIPDDFHHGLIMLLHIAGHMTNDFGIGLRHVCDWAVYADKVDINSFKTKLENMGLWTFACQLTALCSKYLGLREMPWAENSNEDFLFRMLTDILNAGNFGTKLPNRSPGLKIARTFSSFGFYGKLTRKNVSFVEKHPILLPIGMPVYFFKYLWEQISGKKTWIKPSAVSDGLKRKKLYEQFKLFEVD